MTEHVGYDKHAAEGRNGGISRNGARAKAVLTDNAGPVQVDVPRDLEGSFEPVIKKRQRHGGATWTRSCLLDDLRDGAGLLRWGVESGQGARPSGATAAPRRRLPKGVDATINDAKYHGHRSGGNENRPRSLTCSDAGAALCPRGDLNPHAQ